jgi:hypothetical protein
MYYAVKNDKMKIRSSSSCSTCNTTMTPEPNSSRNDEKDITTNTLASGALDDFLNSNEPLSVTINAAPPSPDKTAMVSGLN